VQALVFQKKKIKKGEKKNDWIKWWSFSLEREREKK